MPRGGAREGTGPKPKWNNEETTVIRVPIVLKEQLLDIAHRLDRGEVVEGPPPPLRVYKLHNRDVLRLADLQSILNTAANHRRRHGTTRETSDDDHNPNPHSQT